jgi:hypothetical protein
MIYHYVTVITGQVEAPSEEHARMQALMGVSLTGRLLSSPHEVGVKVAPIEEPPSEPKPARVEH